MLDGFYIHWILLGSYPEIQLWTDGSAWNAGVKKQLRKGGFGGGAPAAHITVIFFVCLCPGAERCFIWELVHKTPGKSKIYFLWPSGMSSWGIQWTIDLNIPKQTWVFMWYVPWNKISALSASSMMYFVFISDFRIIGSVVTAYKLMK